MPALSGPLEPPCAEAVVNEDSGQPPSATDFDPMDVQISSINIETIQDEVVPNDSEALVAEEVIIGPDDTPKIPLCNDMQQPLGQNLNRELKYDMHEESEDQNNDSSLVPDNFTTSEVYPDENDQVCETKTPPNLTEALNIDTTDPQPAEEVEVPTRRLRTIHRCDVCQKTFSTAVKLAHHMHSHSEERRNEDVSSASDTQLLESASEFGEDEDAGDCISAEELEDTFRSSEDNSSTSSDFDSDDDVESEGCNENAIKGDNRSTYLIFNLLNISISNICFSVEKPATNSSGSFKFACQVCDGKPHRYAHGGVLVCEACRTFFYLNINRKNELV